ncbi:MAG: DNA gyrase subunit A, partial [Clostridia bacterium]|nr:DNA gyrase subunit A [Clostridia bacterium]
TEIVEAENDIQIEDLIEKHDCVVSLTHTGYIKRLPADTYSAQHRGGKGIIGMTTKDEDFIEKVLVVYSHSNLMFFTSTGKVYMRKAYTNPEAGRNARGTNIANLIEFEPGEKITEIVAVDSFENAENRYLTTVTRRGVIKRTRLSEYEYQRRLGKKAINLDEGDELVSVLFTDGTKDIMIATASGIANRFHEEKARCMGRVSRGVRGINLRGDDYVVGALAIDAEGEDRNLLTMTEYGFGKRTEVSEFRTMANRGTMGFRCHNVTEKTGRLIGIASVSDSDDIMAITDSGTLIRTHASDVSTYSQYASGVIVMRLSEGQKCASFTLLRDAGEEDEESGSDEDTEPETDAGTVTADFSADGASGSADDDV